MLDVAAMACWLVAGLGLVMVVAAGISRATKRLLRLSDETVGSPSFRRSDTSGLSYGIHWMRPGFVIMLSAGVTAMLLELLA